MALPTLRGPAFILSNHVTRPYCVVTSALGGDPATVAASNLKTEEPTEVARIASLEPTATRWRFDFLGEDTPVDFLALVRSNLSPYGYYRFLRGADDHEWLVTLPGSIGASTNLTGVVGNIDESILAGPDSSYIGPTTNTLAWETSVADFDAPSVAPRQGRAMAAFVVVAKLFGTPTNVYPRLTMSVREGGVVIGDAEAVAERPITASSGTGQILIVPFDPAYLEFQNFSDLGLVVRGSPGDNGSYVKVDTVNLYYEDAAAVYQFDTGWLPRPLTTSSSDYDGPQPTVNLQHFFDDIEILTDPLSRVVALLLDDQTEHAPTSGEYWGNEEGVGVSSLDRLPDGYVEAGVGVVGEAFFLSNHPIRVGSAGPQSSPIIEQFGGTTVGGQSYSADSYRRRYLSVELQVSREELDILKDRIAWRRGKAGAFYFAAEPDIPLARQVFTSGWWTLRSMSGETQLPAPGYLGSVVGGTTMYAVTIELEEKG